MITTIALSASLVLTGSPAQAATKPVFFRGLTVQIPAKWTAKRLVTGDLHIFTGACSRKAAECEGFTLGGPVAIKYGNENKKYTPDQPYRGASTGATECVLDKRIFANGTGNLVRTSKVPFGAGQRAQFTEWKRFCDGKKPNSVTYTQRVWFSQAKQVIVIDEWKTPGLGDILGKAVWK
ncbi:hypothetical protein [Nonomuraea sp. NEAU-A123]|uniref:hypothetical protein n=1 Tax=Nonomuraea sp. NEAU-A123 TaxID=2839649 RepID=UPI001BE3DA3C|nr:hypothetical protein [Nonomuraea sp. NEAU-A123]MBT2225851.1 hypothetical protein [Nonomuraea sp. NEAU-A123]